MKVITARNVAAALPLGVNYLLQGGREEASRAGPVLVAPGPVATVYGRPRERVLFNVVRDANPFFHLLESMWMLAGRDDAAFLNNYVKDFGARFAEPDGRIHGAYGQRWREHFDVMRWAGYGVSSRSPDQLAKIIEILRDEPESRQAVLEMWDAEEDLGVTVKDKPCNTHIYFRVREKVDNPEQGEGTLVGGRPVLDLMVCCRSNDIVWGAYGANAVHFSILQEYMAVMIGVGVGTYTQISFNFHAYLSELRELAQRAGATEESPPVSAMASLPLALMGDAYASEGLAPMALVDDPGVFDRELNGLMIMLDHLHRASLDDLNDPPAPPNWHNKFLSETALNAAWAMRLWRLGDRPQAQHFAALIAAPDWRMACQQWMERRARKLEAVA